MKILDIGNTRIKCYEVKSIDDIKVIFDISAKKQILEYYIENCKEEIYTVSTNKEFEDFIIIKKLKKIDTPLFEKCTNFKSPYEGYGIDRLINSYAASKLYSSNILVVSMGSAITYDIVKNSKIEYGYITPGLTQRKESLSISIPHLPTPTKELEKAENFKKPSNTQEAIAYGITKELLSTINTIKSEENVEVIITGGDADFFEDIFTIDKLLTPKGIFLAFKK
ncbi:type III pantothenate kinase [Hydrogenobaculum acidophilum]